MKFVIVVFPDNTDISSLPIDSAVTIGAATEGTVVMAGSMSNPPAPTLIPHTHSIPVSEATTGPAVT